MTTEIDIFKPLRELAHTTRSSAWRYAIVSRIAECERLLAQAYPDPVVGHPTPAELQAGAPYTSEADPYAEWRHTPPPPMKP